MTSNVLTGKTANTGRSRNPPARFDSRLDGASTLVVHRTDPVIVDDRKRVGAKNGSKAKTGSSPSFGQRRISMPRIRPKDPENDRGPLHGFPCLSRPKSLTSSEVAPGALRPRCLASRGRRAPARWRPGRRSRPASGRRAGASGSGVGVPSRQHYPPGRHYVTTCLAGCRRPRLLIMPPETYSRVDGRVAVEPSAQGVANPLWHASLGSFTATGPSGRVRSDASTRCPQDPCETASNRRADVSFPTFPFSL
jgi:hypothetical protein